MTGPWTDLPPFVGGKAGFERNEDRMSRELVAKNREINNLRGQVDELMSGVMANAPECWEDYEPQDERAMAIAYVRSLEGETSGTAMLGHTDECRCYR